MNAIDMQLDLSAVKERQRWTWASGDYSAIGSRIVLMAERSTTAVRAPPGFAGDSLCGGPTQEALRKRRACPNARCRRCPHDT